jgi:cleavage and polyadenylation specificity factor subunit 2
MREEEEAQSAESDSDDSDTSDSGEGVTTGMKNQLEGLDFAAGEAEDATLKQMSFDIYVKGQQTKTSNFFKTQDTGAPRFLMFPFVEKRRRFDDFGEIIDVSAWLRKGRVLDQVAENDETTMAGFKKAEQQKKVRTMNFLSRIRLKSYVGSRGSTFKVYNGANQHPDEMQGLLCRFRRGA